MKRMRKNQNKTQKEHSCIVDELYGMNSVNSVNCWTYHTGMCTACKTK